MPKPPTNPEPIAYTAEQLNDWPRDRLDQLEPLRLMATSASVAARFIERLEIDEARLFLRQLSNERVAEILAETDEEQAADVLAAMRETRAVQILDDFEPDDAADIVAELDDADRDRLLDKLESGSRASIERLLTYDPDTAGGLMTNQVDTAYDDMTVDQAVERIRGFAEDREDLSYVYVVDRQRRLQGIVSLRKLILAKPWQSIRAVMRTDLRGVVPPDMDKEHVALLMAEHNLADIAVVDADRTLLGVITHDDVLDVVQEEATEDMLKMSGAGGDESIHDDIGYSVRKRQPWLGFNLVTALMAGGVVLLFEKQIGMLPVLAALMPVIATVGGNSGQQSLAVAIRSIALGELAPGDARPVLVRQSLIGLINGAAIGVLAGGLGWIVGGHWLFAVVVLLAMMFNVILGALIGALIPLVLLRIGRDPAQCSSIFLTSITDTGGFIILLSLGTWLLL
jgi:magnesium transporter